MEATNDRARPCESGKPAWTDFAQEHFGDCEFGDKRLTQRAVLTAAAVMRHPAGTLPSKLDSNELLGFYRLANNPKVTHAKMLECHREQTVKKMNATAGVVLLISDTTEADFSGLESAGDELGWIGNGTCQGLLCHNVLAVDFDNRQVLGLANQVTHKRRQVSKNETMGQKRQDPQRESRLWKRALQDVPVAMDGRLWVNVCDRGADMFENIEFWENRGEKYVIRSKSNRKILDENGKKRRLHNYARRLKRVGKQTIHVSENHGQPSREAQVEIGFARVILPAPRQKRGEHTNQPVTSWVVHVREVDAPKGVKPLEWILLSNIPVEIADQAWLCVAWYRCRPMVEELHKAMKTGCGIEQVQFTTRKALEVSLALLSVAATQLVRLRDMSRDERAKDKPATEMIDPIFVEVLSLMLFKRITPLTTYGFCMALAKLGGHLGRKSDKRPGWLVLWRGWMQLQPMVEAIEADRRRRCA